MIIVQDYAVRENSDGNKFIALILAGGLEMVKSKLSGKFYATVRKASIASTVDESTAKALIGSKMPGCIKKIPCDPYEFETDSGESIELDFTYEYQEDVDNVVETVLG
ncbi:MAG: hypothetical protein HUJ25_13390 [Crocinitomicaceae bacterium]|nr:hypothetical protein [Crocinitomicaceae bacterium]